MPSDSPSVYRRLLAGGDAGLRLSRAATLGIVLVGSVLGIAGGAAYVVVTLSALMLAALVARWLGSRTAGLAGLIYLAEVHLLLAARGRPVEMMISAAVVGAMAVFALGNVGGRLPLVDRPWTRCTFYAAVGVGCLLGGLVCPVCILAACSLYAVVSADGRVARFLAQPWGIGVLALAIAITIAVGPMAGATSSPWSIADLPSPTATSVLSSVSWPAICAMAWLGLIVLTVVVGLRQGHYATPIWRWVGCWLLGPLFCLAIVGFHSALLVSVVLPPLAVIAAAGLTWALVHGRRASLGAVCSHGNSLRTVQAIVKHTQTPACGPHARIATSMDTTPSPSQEAL